MLLLRRYASSHLGSRIRPFCRSFATQVSTISQSKKDLNVQNSVDYFHDRQDQLGSSWASPYPHHFHRSMTIPEVIDTYAEALEPGEVLENMTPVTLAGRVHSKRQASSKLVFYDVHGDGAQVQVMSSFRRYENPEAFQDIHALVKRGDVMGITGVVGKSKLGQLSILPHRLEILSPCLHLLPPAAQGLRNPEIRYRRRYLDLIMNQDTLRPIFETRRDIIRFIRTFLEDRHGFLEVETPLMNLIPGGALAKPFTTFHHDLDASMFLRVAPELYLKQLVIGGLDRVFEIGRQFRNEGVDVTHNPEFTSCEFYMAYADYRELMHLTEELLLGLVTSLRGGEGGGGEHSTIVNVAVPDHHHGTGTVSVDFTPPYPRISMIETLERKTKTKIPLTDPQACTNVLRELCDTHDILCPAPVTVSRMLDRLTKVLIEQDQELWGKPYFICDHPVVMSPLAKGHRDDRQLTERFELYVAGMEIANAYTELNDPEEQRGRFQEQAQVEDEEAPVLDEGFCQALEYGLPPTAGWGCGIDRLVMVLTQQSSIRDVLLFPTLKPIVQDMKKDEELEE